MDRGRVLAFVAISVGVLLSAEPPAVARQADDVAAAIAIATEQALAGDVVAQFSLGSMAYSTGEDLDQALAWLGMAAAQGYPPAEYQLGQLADAGIGSPSGPDAAAQRYQRAAENDFAPAQRALGNLYRIGRGVPQSTAEAARWYRLAADAGDLLAQYHLGQLCFDGIGVPQDYACAFVWFSLAAAQTPLEDNRKALFELRDIAAVRMPPDELANALQRVADGLPVR